MKILITGSSGNLGTALALTCKKRGYEVTGIDITPSDHTSFIGSIEDHDFIDQHMKNIDVVFHAAGLHKPHIVTHSYNNFIQTNVAGTSNLLQAATKNHVRKFIMSSTTSIFGDNLSPPDNSPAIWIDESVDIRSKNIYGVTKLAAEELCRIQPKKNNIDCVVLRLSRFFYEDDDNPHIRETYSPENAKVNELLYRRVDIEDAVNAHFAAIHYTPESGFDRFIISATTPFSPLHCNDIRQAAESVISKLYPDYIQLYQKLGWKMFPKIDRVYSNEKARKLLQWEPQYSFQSALTSLSDGQSFRSPLSSIIGWRRYHNQAYDGMPYPVAPSS
ncbi:NAD-dependent epimerase/dehydratase family protein [Serratia sp. NPDC078593]|uniref:NAD-dependent epimerase/dehydratase family protein n=1 Tax=unclassified Serratia (in: enterobacteria) TaxID=2647522 RepID=UPI0037D78E69